MNTQELFERFNFSSLPKNLDLTQKPLLSEHGVMLPPSYVEFMSYFGPGTLGGFLHFHRPEHLQTHHSRLEPFMDDELEELLQDTGNVVIFADSDNGDMCGWQLEDLKSSDEAPVMLVKGFEGKIVAASILELLAFLVDGKDIFGIGALPKTFAPSKF